MTAGGPDRMLAEFVHQTHGVRAAVVVSADGLRQAASGNLGTAMGDQLAAAASGLVSLARGTARLLGAGAVTQTILEMEGGYLFVTAIDESATLAVHTDRRCDLGVIGYEMTLLAARVGRVLSESDPSRHALRPPAPAQYSPDQYSPDRYSPPQYAPATHFPAPHGLSPHPASPPAPLPPGGSPHALSPHALSPDRLFPAGP